MAYVMSRLEVNDYATFESIFVSRDGIRRSLGEKSYQILREDGDPNKVVVLFEWDTLENARNYVESAEVQTAAQHASVKAETDETYYLNESARGTAR
jgi:heme-degrading monooxygenase HmoA